VSEPIDLDDLQRVGVKVRELTDDNWLAEMVEIAAAEIARLREERRWVPVGERLPEGNCKVLTLGLQRYPVVCSFFQFDQSFRDGGVVSGVTNWMPLPPGPEANG
jgi:hypothetical protein